MEGFRDGGNVSREYGDFTHDRGLRGARFDPADCRRRANWNPDQVSAGEGGCADGIGERRIRGLWHGEAKAVRAEELDKLRRVAARKATHEHPIGSELASAAAHFDRLADRLEAMDPEFYRDAIAGYRAMALGSRHLDVGAVAR